MKLKFFHKLLILLIVCFELAEACNTFRRKRRTTKPPRKSLGEGLVVLKWMVIALFAPIVIKFLYQVAKDPVGGFVARRLVEVFFENLRSFLGPSPKYKLR
eukprot:snap_masked-scaffold_5-processed-gene-14.20-mRNA-1 protein AED:0.97 eAED:1.00 QI:0/0/0/0.33/1/1/3/0/100